MLFSAITDSFKLSFMVLKTIGLFLDAALLLNQ
jgi:hypothetical protein